MTKAEFEAVLLGWQAGEVGADDALRRTMREWRTLAAKVWRRWRSKLPTWVEEADLLQVVLMSAPRFVAAYRHLGPGSSIVGFVCDRVLDKADKAVLKWRNARRGSNVPNPRMEPSRIEVPLSSVRSPDDGGEDDEGPRRRMRTAEGAMEVPADQHERAEASQSFAVLIARADTLPQALALRALRASGGSMAEAAGLLYASPAVRLHCELVSERHAHRLVETVLEATEAALAAA